MFDFLVKFSSSLGPAATQSLLVLSVETLVPDRVVEWQRSGTGGWDSAGFSWLCYIVCAQSDLGGSQPL